MFQISPTAQAGEVYFDLVRRRIDRGLDPRGGVEKQQCVGSVDAGHAWPSWKSGCYNGENLEV